MPDSQLEVQDKAGKQEARQLWTHLLAGNMLGERPEAGTAASSLTCCHSGVSSGALRPQESGVVPGYCRQVVRPGAGNGRPTWGLPRASPENPEALNTGGGDLSHTAARGQWRLRRDEEQTSLPSNGKGQAASGPAAAVRFSG